MVLILFTSFRMSEFFFRKTRQPDGLLFSVRVKFCKANLCNTRGDRDVESLDTEYIYCFSTVTECYKKMMGDFLVCVIHMVKQTKKSTCNNSKPASHPHYAYSFISYLTETTVDLQERKEPVIAT